MKDLLKKFINEALKDDFRAGPEDKIAACVLVVSSDGRVLAVSRKHNPHDFGLPGGKVDPGETPWEAARRECEEETGLKVLGMDRVPIHDSQDKGGYRCITYKAVVEGEIDTDEAGVVKWVDPPVLLAGSFGPYNLEVLKKAGVPCEF